ncbi:ASCH domain-containing protein [Paraclostridium bifermentans]|uniref:ASCH domain-containing protein n=1 Tax=Paraclostridium bifermentans TaxID=1490 RepID=A0ABY8R673_PARBF|nr:ASCH domain-containing protein [Paraclostridium bifermentans]
MKNHTMLLNDDCFTLIKNGTKTIEMRLYDEKRKIVLKGDYIIFINNGNCKNQLKVKVIEMHKYKNFNDLYEQFNKIKLGYSHDDFASPDDMEQYYSKENIKKYEVVGIEIAVVNE